MKTALLNLLICPSCLPEEIQLDKSVVEISGEDIVAGRLSCPQCGRTYSIENGVADLDPNRSPTTDETGNKYETAPVVSSYLWSHYADILDEENASDAYSGWSGLIQPHEGVAVDAGAAVGRFTFEMGVKCDFAIGLDNSHAFIETARELMKQGEMMVSLKLEGNITREAHLKLPQKWRGANVEFIVADALALPFRADSVSSLASLNLVDKVPRPLVHLEEMNRVTRKTGAQFLLSDPFSWSEEAAAELEWLGGKTTGPFAGRGLDNIIGLLKEDQNRLLPKWDVEKHGQMWWKIRTHENHFEQIRSCYVKAAR